MTRVKTNEDVGFLNNCNNNNNKSNAQKITTKINGNEIEFEIDTGTCERIVSRSLLDKNFEDGKIIKYNCQMKLISGETLNTFRNIRVHEFVNDKIYNLELTVFYNFDNFDPLLNRNWLNVLFPTWWNFFSSFNSCSSGLNSLMSVNGNYDVVFKKSKNAIIKDFKAEIVIPIFFKPSVVPYVLKQIVKTEIRRLCDEGIPVPVTRSNWASPFVIGPYI